MQWLWSLWHVFNLWKLKFQHLLDYPSEHGIPWNGAVPAELVLALDETNLQHSRSRRTVLLQSVARRVPVLSDRRSVTCSPVISLAGMCVAVQFLFQGKSARCLPIIPNLDYRLFLDFSEHKMQTQTYAF
jgi:hypothetical protein